MLHFEMNFLVDLVTDSGKVLFIELILIVIKLLLFNNGGCIGISLIVNCCALFDFLSNPLDLVRVDCTFA
jgi:hypothetical protein